MSENKEWFSGRSVEARAERHELRKIFGILAIVGALVGLFLGLSGCVGAQPTVEPTSEASLVFRAQHEDGSQVALRIFTEKPCTDDRVLAAIVEKYHAQFKAAILTYQGKDWASCWIERRGYVFSIDEEGAPFQPVPMSAMREEGT